jgi:branched-chain amino acid transport system substrate-binding protein
VTGRRIAVGAFAAALAIGASAPAAGPDDRISGNKLTIYSSLPRQGASGGQAKAIENGAKLALAQRGGKVGDYTVTYRILDDSRASTGAADEARGERNARTAADDPTAVGYIGAYNSAISKVSIPVLNRAGIAQVSPSNTYNGLTKNAPGSVQGEPDKYYPTGRRTYARVLPNDTVQAGALVAAARKHRCKSVHVFNSRTIYSAGLARNIELAAAKAGLEVKANRAYDPRAANYRSLARKVKAPCVIQTGEIESNGVQLLKDVGGARKRAKLFGGDGVCLGDTAAARSGGLPSKVARRFRCTIAALEPGAFGADGRRFFKDYSTRYRVRNPDPYAIYGYESMALLLDSIQQAIASGGGGGGGDPGYQSPLRRQTVHAAATGELTRAKVVSALFTTKDRRSVLGTYSIDPNGDTTLTDYGLYRIVRGQLAFDRTVKAVRP